MIGNRRFPTTIAGLAVAIVATYGAILGGVRSGGAVPSRRPSSLGPEGARMGVLNLPCWDADATDPRVVGARYVRLTGRDCERRARGLVSVKNVTNGFDATVFANSSGLTTDYIPLDQGGNELVIAIDRGAGARVERVLRLSR